ncbi:hypothetical protein, partial [Klebsiella pneumoniae]|uniref:hypothetical protein n=1 Tax=Klebsiella pneumoniae TaxID=573 RepID=UPI00272F3A44
MKPIPALAQLKIVSRLPKPIRTTDHEQGITGFHLHIEFAAPHENRIQEKISGLFLECQRNTVSMTVDLNNAGTRTIDQA